MQSQKVITTFQKRSSINSLIPVSSILFKIDILFDKFGVSLSIGNTLRIAGVVVGGGMG